MNQLEELELSIPDQERLKQVKYLLDNMSKVKVIEPQVLNKLFKMFRYEY